MTSTELRDKLADQATGQEVARTAPTVADLIERQKPQIARALPAHMNTERFTRIVLTECRRTPKLLTCSPQSLLGALMQAAQLGIEPGPLGQAYLVPYGREVSLIVGYRGLIDLARRSGQLLSIVAREVCEEDLFEFEYGSTEFLRHRPKLNNRGAPYAYYGLAKFKDGGQLLHVMDLTEIAAREGRSKAAGSGPWKTDRDAMSRKTVIRAMSPYLPLSPEFAAALEADESVHVFDPSAPDLLARTEAPDEEPIEVGTEGVGDGPRTATVSTDERTSQRSEPEVVPSDGSVAPSVPALLAQARHSVAERRDIKAAGAAKNHRELDSYLNDLGVDMDLENLDADQAAAILLWLDEHPVGTK